MTNFKWGYKYPEEYQRPQDWLPLKNLVGGEDEISMLIAVHENGANYASMTVEVTGGSTYTVDWGDGSTPDVVTQGTQAEHQYDYDDLVGTDCTRGYRQAVISVTAVTGSIYSLLLDTRHSSQLTSVQKYLDIAIACPSMNFFYLVYLVSAIYPVLEQVKIIGDNVIESLNMGQGATYAMQSVELNLPVILSLAGMWYYGIVKFATINAPLCTDVSSMFYNTYDLLKVNLTLPKAITCDYMLYNCYHLLEVNLTLTDATTVESICAYCYSLEKAFIYAPSALNITYTFAYCLALSEIAFYCPAATTMTSNPFDFCRSLQSLNCPDLGAVGGLSFDFSLCDMSAAAIDYQFALLPDLTGLDAGTITVTGNWGAGSCTPSIATAKNWTVVTS